MKKNLPILYLVCTIILSSNIIAQDEDYYDPGFEIFLIDSYVTSKLPHTFILSFFSSDSCNAKVILNDDYELLVTEQFTDQHNAEFDMTSMRFDTSIVPYYIQVELPDGSEFTSEKYELILPDAYELQAAKERSLFTVCCLGSVVFLLPSPTMVSIDGENYFGLSKEVPIISFFKSGYNYPVGYISLEYEYVFNAPVQSFVRAGYKYMIQFDGIEFISPGLNLFTNFDGYNGISPELSVGLFKIYNVFTFYTKYRYNFQPGSADSDMHEISIGLYSNIFSFNF
ncbi:MAG: hypothetical protein HND52_01995 [Ignavibacteriae bacterium]|nr:hypothetical protein [Ignavibacteriota bacterium]NOG96723.1 hypothetical protein [Ignavibacteriota bacterium]